MIWPLLTRSGPNPERNGDVAAYHGNLPMSQSCQWHARAFRPRQRHARCPRLTIVTMAAGRSRGPARPARRMRRPGTSNPCAGATHRRFGDEVRRRGLSAAGVEIRPRCAGRLLARAGRFGVPPTFDFSGSENVKSVTVEWPGPERFPDGAGGNSIGYVGRVVLPLRIVQRTRPSIRRCI